MTEGAVLPRSLAVLVVGSLFAASPALADPPPPPSLSVPKALTAEPQSRDGATLTFTTHAEDWKGKTVPVECDPASGSLFPLGKTRVTCTATDRREESTTGSFVAKVERLVSPGEGATLSALASLRFAWYPVRRARFYNVQLWRRSGDDWKKVASLFPSRARAVLDRRWKYAGRRHRLVPGSYAWYAWPWRGAGYGPLMGRNFFAVVG
jgi:hypothetical protein